MASFFRGITENWKLKILALAIATLLWGVWSADAVTSNWIPVPVQVVVSDAHYRPIVVETREVEVRFSGTGRDLLEVAVSRPPLVLTIDDVPGASAEYTLDPRMVKIPSPLAVSVLDVRPRTLALELERVESRMVPVRPRIIDSLEAGWMLLDTLALDPAEVRVTGPFPQVASVTEIFTQPIEVTSADTLLRRSVGLDTAGIGPLDLNVTSVNVAGRVDRVLERILEGVGVEAPAGAMVVPSAVNVTLRGPERLVRAVQAGSVRVATAPIDRLPTADEGLTVPLRVIGVRDGVMATVTPLRATIRIAAPPTDDLQRRAPGPPVNPDTTPASGLGAAPVDVDAGSERSPVLSGVRIPQGTGE
ncbi:MAG: hypothetical protein LBG44_04275 [Gemmatimonadota bacterium]|jgi:hypothetical protein|nr:hypothetical protein [Gemmatimonadota bacterium]